MNGQDLLLDFYPNLGQSVGSKIEIVSTVITAE
jgi:hypothetical protein